MSFVSVNDAIVRALTDGGGSLTTAEILLACPNHAASTVRAALKALAEAGIIVRPGHGYYSLPRFREEITERAHPPSLCVLPLASVRAVTGSAMSPFEEQLSEYCAIDGPYLRRITGVAPERLVVLVASGTSMVPTIMPGDHLLVAEWLGEPIISHTVYLWRSRFDGITIKRAILLDDGSVALQGDSDPNPLGHMDPTDGTAPWSIIGRVLRVEKPL